MPSHWNGHFPYNWSIIGVWLTGSRIYCFISVIRAWLKKRELALKWPPWIICQPLAWTRCCSLCHSTALSLLLLCLAPNSCKKLWLHFNGQLSHYCSPSFCKSLISLMLLWSISVVMVVEGGIDKFVYFGSAGPVKGSRSSKESFVFSASAASKRGILNLSCDLCWQNPSLRHLHVYFCPSLLPVSP